jgi:hypothetical protein
MKLLDRILLNRSMAIISSFILGILKLFAPHLQNNKTDVDEPVPPKRKRRLRKPEKD